MRTYATWLDFTFGHGGDGNVSASSRYCALDFVMVERVLCKCWRCLCKCPCTVAVLSGRLCSTTDLDNPGQVTKLLFLIAFFQVDFAGEKHAACKYRTRSVLVCFFLMMTEILGVIDTALHIRLMSSPRCAFTILWRFANVMEFTSVFFPDVVFGDPFMTLTFAWR